MQNQKMLNDEPARHRLALCQCISRFILATAGDCNICLCEYELQRRIAGGDKVRGWTSSVGCV